MTDRLNGFTVVLEKDMRIDDFERIKDAVLMLRGVQQVIPHITNIDTIISEERAKRDLKQKIYLFLQEEIK